MKGIVAVLILAVAGVMGYFAVKGECNGGMVVYSEAQCLQSGAISAAACQTVLSNASDLTRNGATVYRSQDQCLQDYEQCIRSSAAEGFVPVPVGFCVSASGAIVDRQEPIFRRQNAGINWGRG